MPNLRPKSVQSALSPSHWHYYKSRDQSREKEGIWIRCHLAPGSNPGPYLDIILVSTLPQLDVYFCPPIISQEVASTFRRTGQGWLCPLFLISIDGTAVHVVWIVPITSPLPIKSIINSCWFDLLRVAWIYPFLTNSFIIIPNQVYHLHGWYKVLLNKYHFFLICLPPNLSATFLRHNLRMSLPALHCLMVSHRSWEEGQVPNLACIVLLSLLYLPLHA